MATSAKNPCPTCGKSFKNLKEHTTKMHDTFVIRGTPHPRGGLEKLDIYRNGVLEFGGLECVGGGPKYSDYADRNCKICVLVDTKTDKPFAVHSGAVINKAGKLGPKLFKLWTYEIVEESPKVE